AVVGSGHVSRGGRTRRVGELVHVLDEEKVRPAQTDLVAGVQVGLALDPFPVDTNTVETVQVADAPAAVSQANLGMLAAAQVVLENDAIGGSPAQGTALGGGQGKDVPVSVFAADHQVSGGSLGHASQGPPTGTKRGNRAGQSLPRKTGVEEGTD